MMQVIAEIKGCPITILVDLGSTHNFISQVAAQRLKLLIQPHTGLQVAIDNGEKVQVQGCVLNSGRPKVNNFLMNFIYYY